MMHGLMNSMKAVAQVAGQSTIQTKQGVVTSYDPNTYHAQVQLMPDDVNTGWIPLKSAWVGSGWGLFCPPSIGDVVEVESQEGEGRAPSAGWRFYNNQNRPLPCPSGEFWLVHKSGSLLKFHNDGSVELKTAGDLNVSVTGHINSSAAQWNHTGPVKINGTALIAGKIIGQGGMAVSGGSGATVAGDLAVTGGNVTADGIGLKTHTHNGVQPGGSNTGQPQ